VLTVNCIRLLAVFVDRRSIECLRSLSVEIFQTLYASIAHDSVGIATEFLKRFDTWLKKKNGSLNVNLMMSSVLDRRVYGHTSAYFSALRPLTTTATSASAITSATTLVGRQEGHPACKNPASAIPKRSYLAAFETWPSWE